MEQRLARVGQHCASGSLTSSVRNRPTEHCFCEADSSVTHRIERFRVLVGTALVVDAASGALRRVSVDGAAFVGFFGASWSPSGRALAFFSVDSNAVVRPWIWNVDGKAPVMLRALQLHDDIADRSTIAWSDDTHLVLPHSRHDAAQRRVALRPHPARQEQRLRPFAKATMPFLRMRLLPFPNFVWCQRSS